MCIRDRSGIGQYGFIDTKGNVVIEPKYRSADPFREGLAHVQVISGEGFINHQGEEVVLPQYGFVSNFQNGTASVSYTHLDVYKRQVWDCSAKPSMWIHRTEIWKK